MKLCAGYSLLEAERRTDRSFVSWQEEQYTDLEPTGILSGFDLSPLRKIVSMSVLQIIYHRHQSWEKMSVWYVWENTGILMPTMSGAALFLYMAAGHFSNIQFGAGGIQSI